MEHYILDELHEPKAVSWDEWCEWSKEIYESPDGFESKKRVAFTQIDGDCHVSTVFLGIDHSFMRQGPPVLFETMVFGGDLDQELERYYTWAEAEAGHAAMVARILA
jgi:hypothetical protein